MRVIVTIPKKPRARAEYVAVPRRDYENYARYRAEVVDAQRKIARGTKAHRSGKTRRINSVRDLMQ